MNKLFLSLTLISSLSFGQNFTKQDTLKGSNTEYRNFWDVKKYEVSVEPHFEDKSLTGKNAIHFEFSKDITNPTFQIDLQKPMEMVAYNSTFKGIPHIRTEDDFIFIEVKGKFKKGEKHTIKIQFKGHPKIAKNAPWDGGWQFEKDNNNNPWMTVSQEGEGASLWLPMKDYWGDEPDNGILLNITTTKNLTGIGNGRLISKKESNNKITWTWQVKNTINGYSIVPSVGKYVNFKDTYQGEKGTLDLDYWVLDYNLDAAKKQFQQVHPMMKAFEYWMGPYPFYEDSYKVVETPHLGMEHQSNVAYGNHFKNGYLGRDLSGTGYGLSWDYILIHETGHEWFANNITASDHADMWIHESFTTYSETLFVNRFISTEAGNKYTQGIRDNISNKSPIIGKYGVNKSGSGDMYPKGANMIHTIRQIVNNDEKFRGIIRGLGKEFYHKIVNTEMIQDYIQKNVDFEIKPIFDQYLRHTKIPKFEFEQNGKEFKFAWKNTIPEFNMPLIIHQNGKEIKLKPTTKVQTITLPTASLVDFNENYYVQYSSTFF